MEEVVYCRGSIHTMQYKIIEEQGVNMDPFKGIAKLIMLLLYIVIGIVIIAAIGSMFQGNFIGILLILFIVLLCVK